MHIVMYSLVTGTGTDTDTDNPFANLPVKPNMLIKHAFTIMPHLPYDDIHDCICFIRGIH